MRLNRQLPGVLTAAIGLSLLLSACATPDVKTFADQTAALGSAIAAEDAAVAGHFVTAKQKSEAVASRPSPRPGQGTTRSEYIEKEAGRFNDDAEAMARVMKVIVEYSTSLSDLAAAGEGGSDALKKLGETLNGLSTTVGVAVPAVALPQWASALASNIAQVVTRIEAQNSLRDAVRVGDEAVAEISKTFADIYAWPTGAHIGIAQGLEIVERGILEDEIGTGRIRFYKAINQDVIRQTVDGQVIANTYLDLAFSEATSLIAKQKITAQNPASGICGVARWVPEKDPRTGKVLEPPRNVMVPGTRADDPNCLLGETVQSLAALESLLATVEPQFQAYTRNQAALNEWLRQRKAASAAIVKAVAVWAKEHSKLKETLDACGGLRALHPHCGNITFANLKLAVDEIKAATGKGDE